MIYMPVLLVLGLLMLYYGAAKPGLATLGLRSTFIIPGAALIVISLVLLGRNIRTSKKANLTWRTRKKLGVSYRVVAVLAILAFSAGAAFGVFVQGKIAVGEHGTGAGSEPLQFAGVREASTKIAAVDSQGNGLLCDLSVEVRPGDGDVFYRIQPYAQVDLQYSAETAAEVAAQMAGIDLSDIDVSFEIDAPAQMIGGPSAGVAMTVVTYAAIENRQVRDDVVVTGEIRPDGSIGSVGAILAKAEAAEEAGKELFLVPLGQSRVVTYRQVIRQVGHFQIIDYEPVVVDLNQYAEEHGWSLEIQEVSMVEETIDLMLV